MLGSNLVVESVYIFLCRIAVSRHLVVPLRTVFQALFYHCMYRFSYYEIIGISFPVCNALNI